MLTALQKADIIDALFDCKDPKRPTRVELVCIYSKLLGYTTDKTEQQWIDGDYEELMTAGMEAWEQHGFGAKKNETSPERSADSCFDSADLSDATTPITSS